MKDFFTLEITVENIKNLITVRKSKVLSVQYRGKSVVMFVEHLPDPMVFNASNYDDAKMLYAQIGKELDL